MDKILFVHITTHPREKSRYIARYKSEFLGAVSLYHFVEMLKTRYPAAQVRFHLPRTPSQESAPALKDAFAMHQAA